MPKKKTFTEQLDLDTRDYLFGIAPKYLQGEVSLRDEAIAETYLKAWAAFNKFGQKKRFLPWIEKVLQNTCKNILKGCQKRDAMSHTVELGEGDIETILDRKIRLHPIESETEALNAPDVSESLYIDDEDPGYLAVVFVRDPQPETRFAFDVKSIRIPWDGDRHLAAKILREEMRGTPQKEIAVKLGLSHANVRQIVSRLRKRIDAG